ncbi:DUF6929 family protein [Algoriphagus sp.]|uniref:DUF6929 family protein n=1 Tax=Algoriphagus sp. TaxID=1872435 RepID=UPI00391A2FC7
MEITIFDEIKIENIPSGSGIIKSGQLYYVIGDDSPFLFCLNNDFKIVSKTPLVDTANFSEKRIEKSIKPDFEALELISDSEIVIFGSGSKSPERNIFMRILLKDSLIIEKYDISEFYSNLRNFTILQDSELNIEAAAYRDNQLFLFNRKKNLIISFVYKDLLAYIKGEKEFPKWEIVQFSLPKIDGIEAGFSGATALFGEPKIIFTASVENTDNAYDDGEILGSFIGIVDISNNNISKSFNHCKIPNPEANLKVESVAIEEEISTGKTKVVLISDDDKGNSTLITALLSW